VALIPPPAPDPDLDPDPDPVVTGKIMSRIRIMSRKKNERKDANSSPFTN
jgi:hypothetical protein